MKDLLERASFVALLCTGVFILGWLMGGLATDDGYQMHCDHIGRFRLRGVTYECAAVAKLEEALK